MRNAVTGGTGFVGNNLVRLLMDQGEQVRVLVRPSSDRRSLAGLPVEMAEGDLLDVESLRSFLRGMDRLYHVAALYSFWVPDPRAFYQVNVTGTRNILEAALQEGISRVVYTSTVGTLGLCPWEGPSNEETPVSLKEMVGHYKRSKFLAEEEAREFAARGLPVVIVNPSTPVGPYDVKPTPTGRMILDFLKERMFAYISTGLNLIDVADVAWGHLLAAEKGRVGQRYILGHRNLYLKEIFNILAKITGIKAPRVRIPCSFALVIAYLDELISAKIRGRSPGIPIEEIRIAKKVMFFDASKAVRELGLPQNPVEGALKRAVQWFRQEGYV